MKKADTKGVVRVPSGQQAKPIVKIDASDGKILKRYKQLNEMARDLELPNSTAYYKIKSQRPYLGALYMYYEEWEKRFPMLSGKDDPELAVTEPQPQSRLQQMIDEQARADAIERADKQTSEPTADMVNHPPHYCTGDIECWDSMVSAFGPEWMRAYATVTAFKYIWRAKHKGRFAEDMKKAAWYEAKAAEMEGNLNG